MGSNITFQSRNVLSKKLMGNQKEVSIILVIKIKHYNDEDCFLPVFIHYPLNLYLVINLIILVFPTIIIIMLI